jgi:hypothetical protein
VIRRIAGVVLRPRASLAELVRNPTWAATWTAILAVWAACGGWLLSTDVGRQALVDERVRIVEITGGTVTDAEYEALQADPPWLLYFGSGGRLLLAPPVTVLVALAVWATARAEGTAATIHQALAIVVHASVVLVIGQVIATPFHYVRESLTSPMNLGAILPLMEQGTLPARFFGTLDLFALWWAGLIASGLSALTGRRASRYGWPLVGLFLAFATLVAVVIAVTGGT